MRVKGWTNGKRERGTSRTERTLFLLIIAPPVSELGENRIKSSRRIVQHCRIRASGRNKTNNSRDYRV